MLKYLNDLKFSVFYIDTDSLMFKYDERLDEICYPATDEKSRRLGHLVSELRKGAFVSVLL